VESVAVDPPPASQIC